MSTTPYKSVQDSDSDAAMTAAQILMNGPNLHIDSGWWDPDFNLNEPSVCFLTGSAGTGKTYRLRRQIEENASWGLLTATTGIAAVNLGPGVTTINSALGYFDTESLNDAYRSGKLETRLHSIAQQYRHLVIDESSMLSGQQLDLIYQATTAANRDGENPLSLFLTGDFCQLPPVNEPWAFEAKCWPKFEANTTRLNEIKRQSDRQFLEALNSLRSGRGAEAADILRSTGVFECGLDNDFAGTTIFPSNAEVDRYNYQRYSKLSGPEHSFPSQRWGRQSGDWKNIPEVLRLREGALIMLLANRKRDPLSFEFVFVNGDLGYVRGFTSDNGVLVELLRNGEIVDVTPVTRQNTQKNRPTYGESFYDPVRHRYVVGEITYMPMRLAYASTVHKSQGLTLDRVQINLANPFIGQPAMAYVAISRVRNLTGLKLIGNPELLATRVMIDPKVARWL